MSQISKSTAAATTFYSNKTYNSQSNINLAKNNPWVKNCSPWRKRLWPIPCCSFFYMIYIVHSAMLIHSLFPPGKNTNCHMWICSNTFTLLLIFKWLLNPSANAIYNKCILFSYIDIIQVKALLSFDICKSATTIVQSLIKKIFNNLQFHKSKLIIFCHVCIVCFLTQTFRVANIEFIILTSQ